MLASIHKIYIRGDSRFMYSGETCTKVTVVYYIKFSKHLYENQCYYSRD